MNWIDYSKQKPSEEGQYLVEYGWDKDFHIINVCSFIDGAFRDWDAYNDEEIKLKGVRYWCCIEPPEGCPKDKYPQEQMIVEYI